MNLRVIRALVVAHIAPARRARTWIGISLLITLVMGLATPRLGSVFGALSGKLDRSPADQVHAPEPAPACVDLPTVALVDPPPWLAWPGPVAAAEDAAVLLGFASPHDAVITELTPPAGGDAVARCLDQEFDSWSARVRRDAGLPRAATPVVFETLERPPPPSRLPGTPDLLPILVLGIATLNGLGVLAGGLPRWRSGGFVETLRATPASARAVMAAGLLAATLVGAGLAAFSLVGWLVGALAGGPWPEVAAHHLLVPFALLPLLAIGQRMLVTAHDTRAAAFRIVGLQMAVGALGAVWFLGYQSSPLAAAAVPVAGMVGLAGGAAPVTASSLGVGVGASLLVSAGLVVDSARRWLREPVEAGDPTAWRRARGELLPEAVVLLCIAVGGQTTWAMPVAGAGVAVTLVFGQVGFMAVPALLTPLVLAMPGRSLLALDRPSSRSLLVAPLVVGATAGLAVAALALAQQGASPVQSEAMEQLERMLGDLGAGPGILLLTVLPALCEELLFRGAVLGLLLPGRRRWVAVLVQAVAFGLLHGMALRFPPTFVIGLLLGVLRLRTGSIWPGVVVHALHNALAVAGAAWLTEASLASPAGIAALGAGVVVGLGALWLSGPASAAPARR